MKAEAMLRLSIAEAKNRWQGASAMIVATSLTLAYLAVMVGALGLSVVLVNQHEVAQRAAAMTPIEGTSEGPGWWDQTSYVKNGTEFTLVGLSGTIRTLPPGVGKVPRIGEAVLSPAAQRLLRENNLPDDYFGVPSGTVPTEVLETPDLALVYRGVRGHSDDAIPFSDFGEAVESSLLFGPRPELEPQWEIAVLYTTAITVPALFTMLILILRIRSLSAQRTRQLELWGVSLRARIAVRIPAAALGVVLAGSVVWLIYGALSRWGISLGGYSIGAQGFQSAASAIAMVWMLTSLMLIAVEAILISRSRHRAEEDQDRFPRSIRFSSTVVCSFVAATLGAYWLPAMMPVEYQFVTYIVFQLISLFLAALVFPLLIMKTGSIVRKLGLERFSAPLSLAGAGIQESAKRIGLLSASLLTLCTYAVLSVIWSNAATALSHDALTWRDSAVDEVVVGRLDPMAGIQDVLDDALPEGAVKVAGVSDDENGRASIIATREDWLKLEMGCSTDCRIDTASPEVDPRIVSWMAWSFGMPDEIEMINGDPASVDGEMALLGDRKLSESVTGVNRELFHYGVRDGFFEHPDEAAQAGLNLSKQKAEWIEYATALGVLLIFFGLCLAWWVEASATARRVSRPAAIFGRLNLPFTVTSIYVGLPIAMTGAFTVGYAAVVPSSLAGVMETPMPGAGFYVAIASTTVAAVVVLCCLNWFHGRRQVVVWHPRRRDGFD